MRWVLMVLGVIVGLVATVLIVGALIPKGHVASRSARFQQPPEVLWEAMTDFASHPTWRTGLERMEPLPEREGRPLWREMGRYGPITYEVVESSPPTRLVTRIADPELPFGGTWTYEIASRDGSSTVTITEEGEIYNVIFRFMARFVFGYTATMEQYLVDLGKRFGEEVVPEDA